MGAVGEDECGLALPSVQAGDSRSGKLAGPKLAEGPLALSHFCLSVFTSWFQTPCFPCLPSKWAGVPFSPVCQDMVPWPLLDECMSATDLAGAQAVDTHRAVHCTHSLPGVALALGRQNWPCLKETYAT